jgi:5-dehydro-2-deoxygluconokinase
VRDRDLLCVGRVCVDLYGEQVGARLEDVTSFQKYVGGSAANVSLSAARLGLRTGLLSGVGEDAFGRFVLNRLMREGIDTQLVQRDRDRLTATVALAIREVDDFPRLFFYADSADMAVRAADVAWSRIESYEAILLTGSYLARPNLQALTLELLRFARSRGQRVALDIDFRPVLWNLVSHDEGNQMVARSTAFRDACGLIMPQCDLIVGTSAEFTVALGTEDAKTAIEMLAAMSPSVIVHKRGAEGCDVYDCRAGALGQPVSGQPIKVNVVNTVGAGDAFLGSFLTRWLRTDDLDAAVKSGNVSGGLVASRHSCADAMPTSEEVEYVISHSGSHLDAEELAHLHSAARTGARETDALVLALDHRWQLRALTDVPGHEALFPELKRLVYQGLLLFANGRNDCGVLIDETYGSVVLQAATGSGLWLARAFDVPASYPLQLMCDEVAFHLRRWPEDQIVKVTAYTHPGDPPEIWRVQLEALATLQRACNLAERSYLLELQASPGRHFAGDDLPAVVTHLYEEGLRPAWWKVPPERNRDLWTALGDTIRRFDALTCQGMLVLGQGKQLDELARAFDACADEPICRGFAIGRSIYFDPAKEWLSGNIDEEELVSTVSDRFGSAVKLWTDRRSRRVEETSTSNVGAS